MSNKFEQLLDYLVNEEMDKANELFHDIVVEKSREIYGDLIAEEAEDEEMDEARDEEEMDEARDEEEMDEARDEEEMDEARDEEADESVEEGYMDDEQESIHEIGGDPADNLGASVVDTDAMGGDDMGMDMGGGEEPATKDDILDIKDDLAELKAEFEALLASEQGEEEHEGDIGDFDSDGDMDVDSADDEMDSDEMDSDDDEMDSDDEESEDEMEEGQSEEAQADEAFMREYREVVGKPYGGGKVAGKSEEASTNKTSVVNANPKDRPVTSATAKNIAQDSKGEDKKAGADSKSLAGSVKGEFTKGVEKNISSSASSKMKDGAALAKNSAGHGAEKKGTAEKQANTKSIVDRKL